MILETFSTPVPYVGVTLDGFPAGGTTIRLWREWDGGRALVRGTDGLTVSGSDFVADWEAPLTEITYRIEVVSGSAPSGSLTATTTLTSTTGWLSDPLNPTVGVPISCREDGTPTGLTSAAAATWDLSELGGTMRVIGDRLPIGYGPGAGGPEGVPLHVITETAEATTALARLLDSPAPQFLIRALPHWWPIPTHGYWRVTRPRVRTHSYLGGGVWEWPLVGTQVRPQTLKVAVPLWTYGDVQALRQGKTYTAVQAAASGVGLTYTGDKADPRRAS